MNLVDPMTDGPPASSMVVRGEGGQSTRWILDRRHDGFPKENRRLRTLAEHLRVSVDTLDNDAVPMSNFCRSPIAFRKTQPTSRQGTQKTFGARGDFVSLIPGMVGTCARCTFNLGDADQKVTPLDNNGYGATAAPISRDRQLKLSPFWIKFGVEAAH